MKTIAIIVSVSFSALLIIGCDDEKSDNSNTSDIPTERYSTAQIDSSRTEANPDTTILSFLRWYRNNQERLDAIPMVNNATGMVYDSARFYSVNFDASEKYLKEFDKSGYVSAIYIDKWRKYFKNADVNFKAHPQNDGPPDYFDYDFVMHSQEFDEDFNNLDSVKVDSRGENSHKTTALLTFISGQKLTFQLTRHGDRWLIDQIDNASVR